MDFGMLDFGWTTKAERLRMVILSAGHQLAKELPPGLAKILETFARVAKSGDGRGLQEELAVVPQDEDLPLWEPIEVHGWKIEATMYLRNGQLWWLVHASRRTAQAPSEKDIKILDKVLEHLGAEPTHHAIIGPRSSPTGEEALLLGWWTWRNGWLLYEIQIKGQGSDAKLRIVPRGTRASDGYTALDAKALAADDEDNP
jgi:hypothetical protein